MTTKRPVPPVKAVPPTPTTPTPEELRETVVEVDLIAPFDVTVDGRPHHMDLEADLALANTWEGINEALVTNSQRYARWGSLEVRANRDRKRKYAALFTAMRERMMGATVHGAPKAPGGEVVKQAVLDSEEYTKLESVVEQLRIGREALDMRMRAALELAKNMRAELDAGLMERRRVAGTPRAEAAMDKLYGKDKK